MRLPCIRLLSKPGFSTAHGGAEFQIMYSEKAGFYVFGLLFFRMTSWLPPSTIDVEETTVSLAFC